jgi:hypothetical protein
LDGLLEKDIQDYYENGCNNIEAPQLKDNWKPISSAMRYYFTNMLLKEKYLSKIYHQSYNENIQTYLIKIDNLNIYTHLRGLY